MIEPYSGDKWLTSSIKLHEGQKMTPNPGFRLEYGAKQVRDSGALEKLMQEKIGRYPSCSWGLTLGVMMVFAMLALAGCSMPGMFGGDDSPLPMPPPLEADADGNVPDKTGRKDTETAAPGTEAPEDSADGAEETEKEHAGETGDTADAPKDYPELADVPQGEEATRKAESSAEAQGQREQLARELASDRERAKYSDEELRGGGVAPAEPPRPQPPAPPRPPQAESAVQAEQPSPATEVPKPSVTTKPAQAAAAPSQPAPQPLAAPAPSIPAPAPAGTVRPAPPAPAGARPPVSAPAQTPRSHSSTAFEPSKAAPLPAEVAATLPPGVAQRYNETLGLRAAPPALPVTPSLGGGAPYASIPFASGSSQLSGGDRSAIQQAAQAWQSRRGRVRVVGHASSSASTQSESQRLIGNWQISQARATAVADAMIQNGVDPAAIVIEAVGDSQAGAASAQGEGEAAARRVDLFLE